MSSNAKKYLGFDDRWLIAMGIPVISVIVTLTIFGTDIITDGPSMCWIISLIYTITYWFSVRYLLIQYHKKYRDYTFDISRLLWVSIRLVFIYFSVKFVLGFIFHNLYPEIHQLVMKNHLAEQISTSLIILMMFFLYEGIYYFNKSRLIEIEKNNLERITAEQKLSTLRNQVNPHFLFNSLNTLVTIIPEEPHTAIEFVQKLSKSYRNILEVRDEKLISIRQELSALESYIYLLKTRFQGKVHIYDLVPENIKDHFILPISLQILMENAVKHNITSTSKPLTIRIYQEEDYICVSNNLQKKMQNYSSTKLGLANIKSRYKILASQEIIVSETDDLFVVKLPIIQKQQL